jgi:chemotaxis protein methyltransferase CheR
MNDRSEVERLRTIVAQRFGLSIDDAKLAQLDELLSRRAHSSGTTRRDCLTLLDDARGGAERRALAQELTVSETFFFRQNEQLLMLASVLAEKARVMRVPRLRILSAGCASGEEPLSLAMLLKDRLAGIECDISIRAVDVSTAPLERARRGRYGAWSLRETPPEVVRRHFVRAGDEHILDASIRDMVSFEERNLIEDHAELFTPASYDAILCRNVIMYFTREAARATVDRIARALVTGGYFVLGYAETLRGLSQAFHLKHTHGTFYYQVRGADEQQRLPTHDVAASAPAAFVLPPEDGTWFEAIEQSMERVRALAVPATVRTTQREAAASCTGVGATDLNPARDLLRKERFGEALDALARAGAASERDPDALLLRAALLTHSGQVDSAMEACRGLIALDELHAGAHYLLALCYEARSDVEHAREHNQIAIYLDPTFAMARLHLGIAARRAGDRSTARRELSQALVLIEREDTARLLLFAGGFERAALVGLCRAELTSCGAAP